MSASLAWRLLCPGSMCLLQAAPSSAATPPSLSCSRHPAPSTRPREAGRASSPSTRPHPLTATPTPGAELPGAGSLHLSRDWGHLTEDCEDGGREEAAQPRPVQEAVSQDQGEVVRGAAGQEEAEAGQDTPGHHHA